MLLIIVNQADLFLAIISGIATRDVRTGDDGSELDCCHFPDMTDADACFPIINEFDSDPRLRCISLSRSVGTYDCNGIWQQINTQSSYIDASVVYGANKRDSDRLRTPINGSGLMLENDGLLPPDVDDSTCRLDDIPDPEGIYCGRSGDSRTNEQPGLAAIHTLFLREHNRIARELGLINPDWLNQFDNDTGYERIFEEARKIVAAEIQHITYNEFLPAVLSPETMDRYKIYPCPAYRKRNGMSPDPFDNCRDNYMYDINVDATITNVFAAAILRFGHSLISGFIGKKGESNEPTIPKDRLDNHFFVPYLYHRDGRLGLERILRWISLEKSAQSDHILEDAIRTELFRDTHNETMDLASLNIQRGRDHGLSGYNTFRQFCGLKTANNFSIVSGGLVNHTQAMAERLETVYDHPDDIDVFVGAMTEKRDDGSLLGPLQQCLMGEMFRRLKFGDRFFYETETSGIGFTNDQLAEIQKSSLASVFCANTDTIKIHERMFQVPNSDEELILCDNIHEIDLTKWNE